MTRRDIIRTIKQEMEACEKAINGETVNGVKMGDNGISYQWLIEHKAALREELNSIH